MSPPPPPPQQEPNLSSHTTHLNEPSWLSWPPVAASTAKAGALTVVVLVASWIFGSPVQSRVAAFLLAAPIVLVLSLVTLAASNVAFSILYARRHGRTLPLADLNAATTSAQRRRTMPGQASRHLFHYLRPAHFTRPVAWSNIEKKRRQEQAAKYRTPIADTMPQLSEAIDSVIELIIRDYVSGWMRAITPEVVLQQRIEELLRLVLIRLKIQVMDLDLTQLLVTTLVPKVTSHVNDFRKAEMALRGNSLERSLTESDELDIMVASKFRNGKLHRALSTSVSTQATEEAYLRIVVQTILPILLPESEVQSEILSHLLRELLVGAVLRPIMDLLSDPDYWNQNVDLYTGKAIREQNMVKKLREALKQHTDNMDMDPRMVEPLDPYGTGSELYSFEDFLKMIKRCDSLLDVKRIRNTIMTQMRKKKALIVNRDKDDIVNGNKVEEIIVYINRLDIAKRRAEKRIEALGGPAYPKRRVRDYAPEVKNVPSLIDLDTILTNPSGLSYFMEFQDRRDNMNELQFWLLVDTLNIKADSATKPDADSLGSLSSDEKRLTSASRGTTTPTSTHSIGSAPRPFEVLTPNSTQSQGLSLNSKSSNLSRQSSRKNSVSTTMEITDTLREDVKMIYETYFAESAPRPVDIDHELAKLFHEFAFINSGNSSGMSVALSDISAQRQDEQKAALVRQQLLVAQRQAFDQMLIKDYPEFVKSDLYFKFLTTYQNSMAEIKEEEEMHKQPSTSRPALFSAIGLMSPEKRRDHGVNAKRSSTGSFLDIFGLGRDKDKEREQLKGSSIQFTGAMKPGFLTPKSSSSKPGSPASSRTSGSATNLPQPIPQQSVQALDVPSVFKPASLGRSRSMSSISNPETPSSSTAHESMHRKSSSALGHARGNSLDLTDTEAALKVGPGKSIPALGDSLLRELQEHEGDEEEEGGQEGLSMMPRMSKKKRGKENVIDAVEAALSSIMETQQQEDGSGSAIKEKDSPDVDATDPAFSTARDNQGADMMEWRQSKEKSTKKRFKEKSLASGKTVRVKSRDVSEVGVVGRKSLDGIFESDASEMSKASDRTLSEKRPLVSGFLLSDPEEEDVSGDGTQKIKHEVGSDQFSDDSDGPSSKEKRQGAMTEGLNDAVQDNVHLAAPGDLLLAARIKKLEQDIETVRKQESIVETLIQKAEKQGRQNELRILKKSKSALRREILGMEYQKTQYEVQEEENMIMPGRSTINITSSTVGHEGSKEFALYVIEVHQMAQDGSYASGWVVARRYSEFFALHQQLKEKFSVVRQYELPGKRGFLKLQRSFVESRRIGLERYLQSLVQHTDICSSQELRAFLSQENVALPQFSASTPALYSLFDGDGDDGEAKQAAPAPPSNQYFFEQLFHSATSPVHTPAHVSGSKELLRGQGLTGGNGAEIGIRKRDSSSSFDQSDGFMKHIYQTVSEGLDDMFSGGPPTVLGNITKQLGNQMMQFSIEADEDETNAGSGSSGSGTFPSGTLRRRHGSESAQQQQMVEGLASPSPSFNTLSTTDLTTDSGSGAVPQRPLLQRIHSSRSRRLSSPDPHTQHQKLQLQKQKEQQQQAMQRQYHQEQEHYQRQQQQQQQQLAARPVVVEPEGVTTFTEPLCDLFIELFELKEKNNWLRRQAVVIILQQVLGGTIERKLRDTIKAYIEESMLTFYVLKLRDALWPPTGAAATGSPDPSAKGYLSGGYEVVGEDLQTVPISPPSSSSLQQGKQQQARPPKVVRTPEQKAMTKDQANRKLSAFLPELLGNMVGHQNARRGARRVFAAFQNRRLNQQLVYTTLDEVVGALWPGLTVLDESVGGGSAMENGSGSKVATDGSGSGGGGGGRKSGGPLPRSTTSVGGYGVSDSGDQSSASRMLRRSKTVVDAK